MVAGVGRPHTLGGLTPVSRHPLDAPERVASASLHTLLVSLATDGRHIGKHFHCPPCLTVCFPALCVHRCGRTTPAEILARRRPLAVRGDWMPWRAAWEVAATASACRFKHALVPQFWEKARRPGRAAVYIGQVPMGRVFSSLHYAAFVARPG